MVSIAAWEGKEIKPSLTVGLCGEHGGDPDSIHFFEKILLDYVSCSPFRVPVARLEAGRAHAVGGRPPERQPLKALIPARRLPTGMGTGVEGQDGMHEGFPDGHQAPRTPTAWLRPPTPQDPVMALLGHHLPLSLIMDLVMPAGPRSGELLADEPPVDTSWLDGLDAPSSRS